jgi:hypothetical protein
MAALAIPIVILGSIYILSEQEKKAAVKNSASQEKIQKREFLSGGSEKTENFSNYKEEVTPQVNPAINTQVNLLSGQQANLDEFRHNNMQHYYGGKLRGYSGDLNLAESIWILSKEMEVSNFQNQK